MSPWTGLHPSETLEGRDLRSLGHVRVERWIAWSIGAVALFYGGQAAALSLPEWQVRLPTPAAGLLFLACLHGPLVFVVLLAVWPRLQRRASAAFAVAYAAAIVVWILAARDPGAPPSWVWYLCTVSCACAAQVFSRSTALIYTAGVSIGVGLAGMTGPSVTAAEYQRAIMDAVFALSLGVVVVTLVAVFRASARRVDDAAASALERYRQVAANNAQESERAEVDALVHDTLLAALHAAAVADTPHRSAVAAAMASDAQLRLETSLSLVGAGTGDLNPRAILRALEADVEAAGGDIRVASSGELDWGIPAPVARALYLASAQAVTNSVEHAGDGPGVRREISVVATGRAEVEFVISDTGAGFDPERVAPNRLGLRVSITGRMSAVGGRSRIESAPGHGTRVSLGWRAAETSAPSAPAGPGAPGAAAVPEAPAGPAGEGATP